MSGRKLGLTFSGSGSWTIEPPDPGSVSLRLSLSINHLKRYIGSNNGRTSKLVDVAIANATTATRTIRISKFDPITM